MTNSNSPTLEPGTLCSSISRSNDEQLFGTATQTQVWFLLEYSQIYGAKAFEESDLPEAVKVHLASIVKSTPGARVQLIKSDASPYPGKVSFFIAFTSEARPRLYEFQLAEYHEIRNLDFQKIIDNKGEYQKYLREEPLYLVCTNGRRDPCCAKLGLPFSTSLSAQEPDSTWQTSHVGGHRFAANLVCFPHGLFYGRLEEADAGRVIETYCRGEFYLEKYRGRSCYTGPVQAAEYFLHTQTGVKTISTFHLQSTQAVGENRWEVLFSETSAGQRYQLVILGVPSEFEILQSCRDTEKTKVMQFRLETYQVVGK